jgi:hypothetical protein
MKALVVAVFIKDDLIQTQINNILELEDLSNYQVIFVQDNIKNSLKYNNANYKKNG